MRAMTFGFLVAALAVTGAMDHAHQREQHKHQCQMIAEGHWPESVNPNCKGD